MAQVLRLRRMGSTNKPFYRIVATDERHPTNGRITETVGWYDPKKSENNLSVDLQRVRYWQANGARVTETVQSLIRKAEKMPAPTEAATAPKQPSDSKPEAARTPEPAEAVEAPAPAEPEAAMEAPAEENDPSRGE
jgi:small subunit ribosomal protein S16